MFQTCFMFTRFALWPRLLYLFHHMLASNNYLVFSGSEEKEVQIIIHNPTWNITWKWGALVRAEAEGEFQGLVLRSNQEQSFFFKKETWEPDNGKKLSLSLVWAKNLVKEREIFSKTKRCQNMFSNQEPGASETSKPLRSRPPWGLPGWPEGRPDGQGGEESGSKIRSTWLAARSSCCATRRWSCCSRCAPRRELGNLDYRWACTVQVSTDLWKMVWKTFFLFSCIFATWRVAFLHPVVGKLVLLHHESQGGNWEARM